MYDILCGVFHKVGLRDKTEIIPTECFFYRMINTLCTGCGFLLFITFYTFLENTMPRNLISCLSQYYFGRNSLFNVDIFMYLLLEVKYLQFSLNSAQFY